MYRKETRNTGSFLVAAAVLLIFAGVRFLDANELSPKANYALIPLCSGLILGFAGLLFWIASERTVSQSCRSKR